jgi:hypothetical protein
MFRGYQYSTLGTRAQRTRERRLEKVVSLRDVWLSRQLFAPPKLKSLLQYFIDATKYSKGHVLLAQNSLLARRHASTVSMSPLRAQHPDNTSFDSPAKRPRKDIVLEVAREAMQSKNRYQQSFLSDQSILVLQLMKIICEISDQKFLLLQQLTFLLYTGEVIGGDDAKSIFITGPSLVHRARQIQWALSQVKVDEINSAPGYKSISTDDTDVYSVNRSMRYICYWSEKLKSQQTMTIQRRRKSRRRSGAKLMANARQLLVQL